MFLVNLGIGIPIHACNYIPEGMKVTLQTENGVLGLVSSKIILCTLATITGNLAPLTSLLS